MTEGLNAANVEKVDAILFAGDLFHDKSTPAMRNTLLGILQHAANIAPVYAIYGNHDRPGDLDIYREVQAQFPITIFNRPVIGGIIGKLNIVALPYPSKAWLHAGEMTMPEGDASAASALRQLLQTWAAEIKQLTGPVVFLGQVNVSGSVTSTGQPMIGRELEVSLGDLLDLGCNYCALGHIHKPQQMGPACYYAGSVSRMDFGESEEKGWNLVNLFGEGHPAGVQFMPLPARQMFHIDGTFDDVEPFWHFDIPEGFQDADVRFRYHVAEELIEHAIEDPIRDVFHDAHSFKMERIIDRKDRVRSEEMSKAQTLEDKIEAYWKATERPEIEQADRVLRKATEIMGVPSETE